MVSNAFYPYTDKALNLGTSTYKWNNIYAGKLLIEHVANNNSEIKITYGSTISMWFGVGAGNENHGIYDDKADKWILSAGSDNKWNFVGNAATATTADSAATADALTSNAGGTE